MMRPSSQIVVERISTQPTRFSKINVAVWASNREEGRGGREGGRGGEEEKGREGGRGGEGRGGRESASGKEDRVWEEFGGHLPRLLAVRLVRRPISRVPRSVAAWIHTPCGKERWRCTGSATPT